MDKIEELDLVALNEDLPKHKLVAGDIGTVVYVYGKGKAFEVEFSTGSVYNSAVVTLEKKDVRLLSDNDMLHARPLSSKKLGFA